MDPELAEFLTNMTRTFQREVEALRADMTEQIREVRADMRDVREEIRSFKAEVRDVRDRISKVADDYRDARRVRDIRAISVEARLEEVERRLTDLEGGTTSNPH